MSYQSRTRLNDETWVTDARVPDPEHIPIPLGWNILIRPYRIETKTAGGIILTGDDVNFESNLTNIGRVVAIGPCCWSRSYHLDKDGNRFDWVKIGDFISYPKHVGHKRKYKGVSFVVLNDDEVTDLLPDPHVYNLGKGLQIDIPQEDLEKYNTIYNKNYKLDERYQ